MGDCLESYSHSWEGKKTWRMYCTVSSQTSPGHKGLTKPRSLLALAVCSFLAKRKHVRQKPCHFGSTLYSQNLLQSLVCNRYSGNIYAQTDRSGPCLGKRMSGEARNTFPFPISHILLLIGNWTQ